MANVFIRPSLGGPYGAADGSTYADAFAGFDNMAGVADGDTVWIGGGVHAKDLLITSGGSSAANTITYRGDVSTLDSSYVDGTMAPTEGSVSLYFNASSASFGNVTVRDLTITNTQNLTGAIFVYGGVGGLNAITNLTLKNLNVTNAVSNRGLYINGNLHTFTIDNVNIQQNPSVVGSTQAVFIFGNSATAGAGGTILDLTVTGLATYANTSSNHVGLHVDDWNGLLIENYTCTNMFSGVRLTNADSNTLLRPNISGCGLGLKSDASGGGYGITLDASSASNKVIAGRLDNNYQHYVDSVTSGGNNELHGSLLTNPLVNSISYVSTSNSTGLFYNNIIIHNPADTEGHGLVVQNGGAVTKAKFINNLVVCGTTGANIQCVAVGGVSGTNYQDIDFTTNAYYVTNGAIVGELGVTEYATLAAWSVAANADIRITETTVIDSDPLLTSDYKLGAGSPCIGAGTTGLITGEDTYDQPIPSFGGVDIGNQSTNGPFHPVNL